MISELDEHWEVLAEAIQTILRKEGQPEAYEKLKDLTRGEKIDIKSMAGFIQKLKISDESKDLLMALTPEAYIGNAAKVVESI